MPKAKKPDNADEKPDNAVKGKKSIKLDFTRPYGTVHGSTDNAMYEQDGYLFDINCVELSGAEVADTAIKVDEAGVVDETALQELNDRQ